MKEFKFPSSSSPKIYTTLINDNGLLSCDCPGWTVKKLNKPRWCKHCEKVMNDEGLLLEERDGQMFVSTSGKPLQWSQPRKQLVPATKGEAQLQKLGIDWGKVKDIARTIPPPPTTAAAIAANEAGFINPMLASAMPEGKNADSYAPAANATPDWIAEEKFDGHRLVVRVYDNVFYKAWSRLGNERTLPLHIANLMVQMPNGVYDGELIVPTSQHSYSVTAGQNSGTEALVLFDMLETDQESLMKYEQSYRRQMLEIAFGALDGTNLPIFLAPQFMPSMAKVQEIWDRGGEGAIIKKLSAKYSPGWRTPDWIKVKAVLSATLLITGFSSGKSGPYSVVNLRDSESNDTRVKVLDNDTLRAIAHTPSAFIGKRLVISFQERTPSGNYRHPMWDHMAGVGE